MTIGIRPLKTGVFSLASLAAMLASASVQAQPASNAPTDLIPPAPVQAAPAPVAPVPAPTPAPAPALNWTMADAQALLSAIQGIGREGLKPADYQPTALAAAIAMGEGPGLNEAATRSFTWLVEDLRDGRTPMKGRLEWFVDDPDPDVMPTDQLLKTALTRHDVPGVLKSLEPKHPDYAVLRDELARTPATNKARIAMIQANMDRWRWLQRDLGPQYLITNVPEYMLRLVVKDKIITTYRTIVGKPGKTATPQLAEMVEGVIYNPTWTVPQSIVKGEGLGAQLLASPASAKAKGYKVTKSKDGTITVVQQPGPQNALGVMKLDMPNPHAIFLHDTPSRGLFASANRALSHGCIRTERASELAMTLAILGADMPAVKSREILATREYTRVGFTKTMPVYITYFTMATDVNGKLTSFKDLYGRDKAVLDSFAAPRVTRAGKMVVDDVVKPLEAPGA